LTVFLLVAISYDLGRRLDPSTRFFDPRQRPTVDDAGLAIVAEYALRPDDNNAVVFIGDSACHDGINPLALGVRSFNLGTQQGAGPTGMLVLLKCYLSRHPAPRLICLCASPLCFEQSTGATGHPERFIANYGPEVEGIVSPFAGAAYFTQRGFVSLFEHRDAELWDRPLLGLETETYRSLKSRMEASRGFFSLPGEHGFSRPIDVPGPESIVHFEWDSGVKAIIEACAAAELPLLFRFAPVAADLQNARDFSQLDAWCRELKSSYPNVRIARPVLLPYDRQFMWDPIHLNAAGVEKFMPVVAKDVEAALAR
jgi:hypothetical protein